MGERFTERRFKGDRTKSQGKKTVCLQTRPDVFRPTQREGESSQTPGEKGSNSASIVEKQHFEKPEKHHSPAENDIAS